MCSPCNDKLCLPAAGLDSAVLRAGAAGDVELRDDAQPQQRHDGTEARCLRCHVLGMAAAAEGCVTGEQQLVLRRLQIPSSWQEDQPAAGLVTWL